ncbi:hypothetical protein ABIC85_002752 [Oerskovia enterophila]
MSGVCWILGVVQVVVKLVVVRADRGVATRRPRTGPGAGQAVFETPARIAERSSSLRPPHTP